MSCILDTQKFPGLDEMNTYGPRKSLVVSGINSVAEALEMMFRTRAGSVEVLLVDLLICCMFPTCYYKISAEIPYNIRGNHHLRNFYTL